MTDKLRTLLRRAAAAMLGDYPPPRLAHTEELHSELAAAAADANGPAGNPWSGFTAEIAAALREQNADAFLRIPVIAKTLHSRQRSLAPRYLAYLRRSGRFTKAIQQALGESPVGKPLVNPHYPFSSPLLVQHGYHLVRLLEATDCDLPALRLIVEFGGGYGSFYRLLRNLGYAGAYRICDLPVMCALQRFYLRNVFPTEPDGTVPGNVRWLSGAVREDLERAGAEHAPSLFVATWSLSETPLAVRRAIAPALARFHYILCAYQRTFHGYDNRAYFDELERGLPQYRWLHAECPAYRNNFYLIGQRRA